MAAHLRLSDSDVLLASTGAMDNMLFSLGERLDDTQPKLAKWLKDVATRPAPLKEFDVRGLGAAHQEAFWSAAHRLWADRGAGPYDDSAIGRLLSLRSEMDTRSPAELTELEKIDLTEIWDPREWLVFELPSIRETHDRMGDLVDGRMTREAAALWGLDHLPPEIDSADVRLRLNNETALRYVRLLAAATTRMGSEFTADLEDFRRWAAEMPPS